MSTWLAKENAIAQWVLDAGGVPVRWANQGGPYGVGSDAYPFCSLAITGSNAAGAVAEYRETTDLDQVGEEVGIQYITPTVVSLSVQAVHDSGHVIGDDSARGILARVRAALKRESVRDALGAAGLGLQSVGPLRDLTALFITEYESRAQLDVFFHAMEIDEERVGYIKKVTGTIEITGTPAVPFTAEES